ncbi:hypothetical protein Lal_00044930 [Lupinus albus]|nr:hypothetical protein Lal_00044930 [Lupinus albus]
MKFVYRKCHKALGALIGLASSKSLCCCCSAATSANDVAIFADELAKTVGVKSTEVGYIGGKSSNPTYEQVCSAVKVTFDQSKSSYKSLIKRFLEIHNPYADISVVHGGQYKSALFYLNSEQHKEAKEP